MSEGRTGTAIGAILFVVLGFLFGAMGSAWMTRDQRAAPWRKIKVEHEGKSGSPTRTRLLFANPKLPLQAIEVYRNEDGKPDRALIALRDGKELIARFEDGRPTALEGPTGSKALFSFKGEKARVAFFSAKGKEVGDKVVRVPVGLQPALKLAALVPAASPARNRRHASWSLINEAFAQEGDDKPEKEDPTISVERRVTVELDISLEGKGDSGKAQIEANCEPFTCLPVTREVKMPGESRVVISVAGTKKQSELKEPGSSSDLGPFRKVAAAERDTATEVLPDVSAAVAAVGVVALACRSLKLSWTVCVKSLGKDSYETAAAIASVLDHEVAKKGREVDERAETLYFQEEAREALDQKTTIEVCASRDGFARACTKLSGKPLGDEPMGKQSAKLKMRRGIGGTLSGSFVMTQSDGAGCKFSPSPRPPVR